MRYIALILFLFSNLIFADVKEDIKTISNTYSVDEKLIYAIIKTETNFEPYVISGTFKNKDLLIVKDFFEKEFKEYSYKQYKTLVGNYYNEKKIFTLIFNNKQDCIRMGEKLLSMTNYINFDIGVMQLNVFNWKNKYSVPTVLDITNNIYLGTGEVRTCYDRYKKKKSPGIELIANTIECYNKGFREKRSFDYFSKVYNNYLKL